jgi:hypothetical protein
MEQDIKILEGMLGFISVLNTEQRQALENLIKGYREKEESEKYLYDAYQDAGKKMFEYAEENEKLKELYIRTAKHLEEIGKPEMAEYFLAQIEAIPTWNVGEM